MIRTLLNSRTNSIVLFGLLLLGSTGCSVSPGKVWVYIDNAGNQPLSVSVDGKPAATIEPGKFAELSYPPGDYQFRITSGDKCCAICLRKLEKSDRFGVSRQYLFNPDKINRYQTYHGQVRRQPIGRRDGSRHAQLPKRSADQTPIHLQAASQRGQLLPTDAWNDVSGIDYVLTAPPDKVMARQAPPGAPFCGGSATAIYEQLKGMEKIEKPTDEDIDSLDELLDEILSDAP